MRMCMCMCVCVCVCACMCVCRCLDAENHKRSSSRLTFGKKPAKWWVTGGGADVDLTEGPDALPSATPAALQLQSQKSSRSSNTPQHAAGRTPAAEPGKDACFSAVRHSHSSQQRRVASLAGREEEEEVVDTEEEGNASSEEEVVDTDEEGNEGEATVGGESGWATARKSGRGGGEEAAEAAEAGSFQCSTCSKLFESLQVLCLLRRCCLIRSLVRELSATDLGGEGIKDLATGFRL